MQVPGPRHAILPIPLTTFVGREAERATIAQLLASSRLVTLTDAGGSGKTRLAVDVAAAPTPVAADAVFVDLAVLGDPELVPAAIAGEEVVEAGELALLRLVIDHPFAALPVQTS